MRILNRNVNNSTRASSSDDERFRLWLVWYLGGEIVVHLLILAVTGLVVRLKTLSINDVMFMYKVEQGIKLVSVRLVVLSQ